MVMKMNVEPEPEDKKGSSKGFEEPDLPKKAKKIGAVAPICIED